MIYYGRILANHTIMTKRNDQQMALELLKYASKPLSISALSQHLSDEIPLRTLRRWLAGWIAKKQVLRSGSARATRYQFAHQISTPKTDNALLLAFLRHLDADLKANLLTQIRDLWTHTSTALEGNTLSLGDTHFILEQGLTVSGKPIREHQEVIGHAKAIDLLYQCLHQPLTEKILFDLHKAVQSEPVFDIYKPNGDWKAEPNGTYAIDPRGNQVFIEYAMPVFVPALMAELINEINEVAPENTNLRNAPYHYAKIHMGIAHIHPFWDGNGRIARLLANIPLLKAGLPPLVISQQQRRTYIQVLANYQLGVGQLTKRSGVWPELAMLKQFSNFCAPCYDTTSELVKKAHEIQDKRS
ncbi:MAG: fido (protein-threonine AMPylation protein) [Parasphingorhabdus sp.]|jgi:fido (protein-threonine AMPylation protein)